jgi:hypothetical protein
MGRFFDRRGRHARLLLVCWALCASAPGVVAAAASATARTEALPAAPAAAGLPHNALRDRAVLGRFIVKHGPSAARALSFAWHLAPNTPLFTQAQVAPQLSVVHLTEAPTATADAQLCAYLRQLPDVQRVERDIVLQTLGRPPPFAHRDLRGAQDLCAHGCGNGPLPQGIKTHRSLWRQHAPQRGNTGPEMRRTRVGLLDTGIDTTHPDLQDAVAPGVNLLSARSDLVAEADDPTEMDYNGHGTGLAGIVGASHNTFGIDGIDHAATVVGIKVFDAHGNGALSDVLRGVHWARAHAIDILNMSFGTQEPSKLLAEALAAAQQDGMLLVAAAGNDGTGVLQYPAAYPGVLAVGSCDASGTGLSHFSNFSSKIAYYAPGDEVVSLTSQRVAANPYAPLFGTSAAAAHVSGALSVLLRDAESLGPQPATLQDNARAAEQQLAAYSHLQSDVYDPDAAPFRRINTPLIVANAAAARLQRLHILRFVATPETGSADPATSLKIQFNLLNSGNVPYAGSSIGLRLRSASAQWEVSLGQLPTLQPGENFELQRSVPLPQGLQHSTTDQSVSLHLVGRRGAALPDLTAPAVQVLLQRPPTPLLRIKNIWLQPGTPNNLPPQLHLRVVNLGGVSAPSSRYDVAYVPAVHEGIWHLEPQPLLCAAPLTLPPVAPHHSQTAVCTLTQPLQPTGPYTLIATRHGASESDLQARAVQSFMPAPPGTARLLYNQRAHMASVQAAVDLLRLQNVHIPDLHAPLSRYLGTAQNSHDWGSAISVGTRNYRWDWQKQWNTYPLSSKTLIDGASAADAIDITYGDTGVHTWDSHYWIVDEGDSAGMGERSALKKIQALMLGDRHTPLGAQGAIELYRTGHVARAWWMVGHAAHLLGDLSTGAHTLNRNWHGVVGDPYHDWIGQEGHYRLWPAEVVLQFGGLIDPYGAHGPHVPQRSQAPDGTDELRAPNVAAALRFLTYTTAQIGSSYPWHRLRGWLPTGENGFSDGNRVLGGDPPHYTAYLQRYFKDLIDHPHSIRDIASYEVRNSHGVCIAPQSMAATDKLDDCWDGGDGHTDFSNILSGDADGDLSRVADAAYTYAVRSIAGLITLFAKETGQL